MDPLNMEDKIIHLKKSQSLLKNLKATNQKPMFNLRVQEFPKVDERRKSTFKEFYLLGYNAVWSGGS
jgi:hypothetical protein